MLIKDAHYVGSWVNAAETPSADVPEFAFIGRSNVGKSSLINMLVHSKSLVKVSSTPGKTQALNFFLVNDLFHFVDLPGYGFARVSRKDRGHWQKMIKDYLKDRKQLLCVFVLVDARHEPQKIDVEFINKLGEWGVPFCVVFTKVDKTSRGDSFRHMQLLGNELKARFETIPPFFRSSAETREGEGELLGYMDEILTGNRG